jgi:hypothetical protein
MGWGEWGNWCDVPTITCSDSLTLACNWINMNAGWYPDCDRVKIEWKVTCCAGPDCGWPNPHFDHTIEVKVKIQYQDGTTVWKSKTHTFRGYGPESGEDWFDVDTSKPIEYIDCYVLSYCDCLADVWGGTATCRL